MKNAILVSVATLGLAVSAQAQSLQASGASLEATGAALSNLGNASLNDIKSAGISVYEGTIQPTVNASVQTYEVSLRPAAVAVSEAASATGRHIKVYYLNPTGKAAAASFDATVATGASVYDNVLLPLGQATGNVASKTGEAIEFVAVSAYDLAKDVAVATANGAQYSWNEVMVPAALLTGDNVSATGEATMEYVVIPTVNAARILGAASANAASATGAATGDFSGDMSVISGDLSDGVANSGRRLIGRDAKVRRAEQRRQSEDALRGN